MATRNRRTLLTWKREWTKAVARVLRIQRAGHQLIRQCRALAAARGGGEQLQHLGELIAAEVLVASGQNLLFAHPCLRRACAAELTHSDSHAARGALAEYLKSSPEAGPLERLQAAVHWLAIGDERGRALAVHESLWLVFHEFDTLGSAAPALESALSLMRSGACSPYDEAVLLATLTMAGLEGERRLVLQYSEPAIRVLEQLLGLLHARKLKAYLGGKLCAGLGQLERSRELLDQLQATHGTSQNPLFAAQVCGAAFEVALITGELAAAQEALARIAALYRPLSLPSLAQHVTELAARLERARIQPGAGAEYTAADQAGTESTWQTAADGEKLPQLAKRMLQALAENALATQGALYLVQSGHTPQLCATLNSQRPSPFMQRCAEDYMANEVEEDQTLLTSDLVQPSEPSNIKRDGAWHHLVQRMSAGHGDVVGLAVLGREREAPLLCPNGLLRSFADQLQTASASASSESSSPPTVLCNAR